ncbi:MAG: hypothetical protein ACI9S8_000498 [Chlamydiales bacterium]|jgi:hypothetical protein
MSFSGSHIENSKVFVNRRGEAQIDANTGICAWLTRKVTSLLGIRNYHLEKVLTATTSTLSSTRMAGIPNQRTIHSQNVLTVFEKLGKKSGLDPKYALPLILFSRALSPENTRLCIKEKAFVKDFLKDCQSNRGLNKSLTGLKKHLGKTRIVSSEAFDMLIEYSYKSSKLERLEALNQKIQKIDLDNKNLVLPEDQKLTLNELAFLESMSKLKPITDQFNKIVKNCVKRKFIAQTQSVASFVEKSRSQMEGELKQGCPEILTYDLTNFQSIRREDPCNLSFKTRLNNFIFRKVLRTPIFHLSMSLKNTETQEIEEAHIWSKFSRGRRPLTSYAFRSIRMNVKNMVSVENREKLKKRYGDNWGQEVEKSYNQFVHERLDPKRNPILNEIQNTAYKRFFVGMGFKFGAINFSPRETAAYGKTVVCSELTAKTMAQALLDLNESFSNEWKGQAGKAPLVNSPIRKKRRLDRFVPSDVRYLLEKNYASLNELSPTLKRIASFHELPKEEILGVC